MRKEQALEVRQVTLEEMDGVLSLIDEFDRPQAPWPSAEEIETIYRALVQNGGCVVGAFLHGGMVATCTVNVCPNFSWSGRPYAMIENVIVSQAHRNQGIGKAVLAYAQRHAQEKGCYKVALMTGSKRASTLQFYESAGFTGDKTGFQVRFVEQIAHTQTGQE